MDLDQNDSEEAADPDRAWAIPAVAGSIVTLVTIGSLGLGPFATVPAAVWTLVSVLGIITIVGLQRRN